MSQAPKKQKSNEWFTPAKYIEAAREVMGGIDLDPASCEMANRVVRATRYYTKEENGLMQPWYGRVWLNPPFGLLHPETKGSTKSWQQCFADKLLRLFQSGEIDQACFLTLALSKKWLLPFWSYPTSIVSDTGEYLQPDGSLKTFGFGILIFYLGPNESRFIEVFSKFGRIVRAIDTPKPRPVARELWQEVACD